MPEPGAAVPVGSLDTAASPTTVGSESEDNEPQTTATTPANIGSNLTIGNANDTNVSAAPSSLS